MKVRSPATAPDLILDQPALALRADEGAYEQGYKKGIDLGEVH